MKIAEISGRQDVYTLALSVLNALPDDEVLTSLEMANKLNVLKDSGHVKKAFSKLRDNRMKIRLNGGDTWVYGKPEALKKLRDGITNENR